MSRAYRPETWLCPELRDRHPWGCPCILDITSLNNLLGFVVLIGRPGSCRPASSVASDFVVPSELVQHRRRDLTLPCFTQGVSWVSAASSSAWPTKA